MPIPYSNIKNTFSVLVLSVFVFLFSSCSSDLTYRGYSPNSLKDGDYVDDDSYIYSLPYAEGERYLLAQAYDSHIMSHKDEFALDFRMKTGTKIMAARPGEVIAVKEDSQEGGIGERYLSLGNHVVVRHDDGTEAGYWHLKYEGALVKVGDKVEEGQHIAISGNTGYTAFPHLHFYVWEYEHGVKQTIPTRFRTSKGVIYLRPGRKYGHP